jgi:hypothetical protein
MDKETYEKYKEAKDYLKIYFEYYKEKVKDEKYKLQSKCTNFNDFERFFMIFLLVTTNSYNIPALPKIFKYYDELFNISN